MISFKVPLLLFYITLQLHAIPKFQPISSVNIRPTSTWIPGPNNNKYQFHIGWQSWLSAREYCLSQDADLVSINSQDEFEWIMKHYVNDIKGVGERHIQIGLFLPSSSVNDWIWVDKSTVNKSFLPFEDSSSFNGDKKCADLLINKNIVQPVMCDVAMNLPDKPVRFICERSNENHLALERANNPLWDKFDKILQFLGISDGNSGSEKDSKKKGDKKSGDDYYSDDSEFDSREFDKNKKIKNNDVVLLTFIDSKDSKNLNVTKEIDSEGSGDGGLNDFENIMTRKPEDIASSTPIVKDDKIDRQTDEGNRKLVQIQQTDGILDNGIIRDNLFQTTSKLTTTNGNKNIDIEGSGEDIVKVENKKNIKSLSLKDHNTKMEKNITIENNKVGNVMGKESLTSSGHVNEELVSNNIEIDNVEEKIVKFFKVLYQYLQKRDVKSLKEILDTKDTGISIIDHLKKSLNATNEREISQVKALDKLYQMGVNLEKVRHEATNTTMDHNAVKMVIKEIEEELTDDLVKNMSEEFDEVNNLANHHANLFEKNKLKNIKIINNITTTQKQSTHQHSITTHLPPTTKKITKKHRKTNVKGGKLKKSKKNRKNKKGSLKSTPKVIDSWHPEVPPTEEQKKEFAALEKSRVKLNNDTFEIFKNFNENERTKKLLERIQQHEMEKKRRSEKEPLMKVNKNKSQENGHNDVDGLMNLVTKTDKTVHNFIDIHNQ